MNAADFQAGTPYALHGYTVADATVDERRTFIRKTYTHLAAAVYAFVALEFLLFSIGFDDWMMQFFGQTRMAGLILMGAFLFTSWIANSWAQSEASVGKQYAGLFLYVLLEAIIFVPLLTIAQHYAVQVGGVGKVGVIPVAAVTTLIMFGGLSAVVLLTKKDFSFLRNILWIAGLGAFVLILVSAFAGFNLGVWFSAGMIIMACGWILYDTSNVLHHYRPTQHVAASLALFASVALLFWYILRIVIQLAGERR